MLLFTRILLLLQHMKANVCDSMHSKSISILGNLDEIHELLEDTRATMFTLRSARYNEHIRSRIEEWERRLALLSSTLNCWQACQRGWLYLEHIFAGQDMQRQMPAETRLFGIVDRAWHDLMRRTQDHTNALQAATRPGVLQMLQVFFVIFSSCCVA